MRRIELSKTVLLNGGYDCSTGSQIGLIVGAGIAGGIFFGAGAFVTVYAAVLYNAIRCNDY